MMDYDKSCKLMSSYLKSKTIFGINLFADYQKYFRVNSYYKICSYNFEKEIVSYYYQEIKPTEIIENEIHLSTPKKNEIMIQFFCMREYYTHFVYEQLKKICAELDYENLKQK